MNPINLNRPFMAASRASMPILKRTYIPNGFCPIRLKSRHDIDMRIKNLQSGIEGATSGIIKGMAMTGLSAGASSFCLFGHYKAWEYIHHLDYSTPTLSAITCVAHAIGLIPTTLSLGATLWFTVYTYGGLIDTLSTKIEIKNLEIERESKF